MLAGTSGSGKSTLCRTINRLEPIDSGTITFAGTPLPEEGKGLARLRSEVGMVFQSFNLFAHKTVLQNVTLGPVKVRGTSKRDAEELSHRLLDRVGVGDQAATLPHSSPAASSSASRSLARDGAAADAVRGGVSAARRRGVRQS